MSKSIQPYAIVQRRIDIVTKVPAWAQGVIEKGAEVIRLDAHTVAIIGGRSQYKLGESYTKFKGYTAPL
jgi:predicted neuraminidase